MVQGQHKQLETYHQGAAHVRPLTYTPLQAGSAVPESASSNFGQSRAGSDSAKGFRMVSGSFGLRPKLPEAA
eukprot:12942026-Alexandrium_andersonii.AAC.1